MEWSVGFRSIERTPTTQANNQLSKLSEEPAQTTKRTNRGRLSNPDRRGNLRPEVGDKRFSVGNIRDVGTSEMQRRLAELRNLFERQCQSHEIDHWAGSVLSHAKKLAAGERGCCACAQPDWLAVWS
ncbi:hypothetical protein RISK_003907 [Rhodopirellula islandica]|uniref:Uncharacterized protein n=1 Tax=Rhodopirellula islandica TaxID=595434 RepID=A0A0J1BBM6_RHOIS|nr:hypothetical protein RISK_003907 [Rhodopirellula islandica]